MAESRIAFDDPEAYERYMGRWSRAIGEKFLAWVDAPAGAAWLDVGCGSGAFTDLIAASAAPRHVTGIDPSPEQIGHASGRLAGRPAEFRVGSAVDLPFSSGEFDVVVSALAIHFFPDRPTAFREMLRVTRPGGIIAGYTWRKAAGIIDAPYGPLAQAVIEVAGDVRQSATVPEAMPEGLSARLAAEGYREFDVTTIEASQTYRDFEDYWNSQTATFPHPVAQSVAALTERDRDTIRRRLRSRLTTAADGSVSYISRATAFKARKLP